MKEEKPMNPAAVPDACAEQIKKRARLLRRGAAAACLVLAAVLAYGHAGTDAPAAQKPVPPVTVAAQGEQSPDGIRKFMNYNGCRYAFLENGAAYNLAEGTLAETLGTLKLDLMQSSEANAGKDFSTTFALGGTVYRMEGRSPEFRLAVEWEGKTYLCENVDHADGTDPDLAEYFAAADFENTVTGASIYDHYETQQIAELNETETAEMIAGIAAAVPANLTNDEYPAIGAAQSEGKSFRIVFALNDGTAFRMYMIPSLKLVSVGDNYYKVDGEWKLPQPEAAPQPERMS